MSFYANNKYMVEVILKTNKTHTDIKTQQSTTCVWLYQYVSEFLYVSVILEECVEFIFIKYSAFIPLQNRLSKPSGNTAEQLGAKC